MSHSVVEKSHDSRMIVNEVEDDEESSDYNYQDKNFRSLHRKQKRFTENVMSQEYGGGAEYDDEGNSLPFGRLRESNDLDLEMRGT